MGSSELVGKSLKAVSHHATPASTGADGLEEHKQSVMFWVGCGALALIVSYGVRVYTRRKLKVQSGDGASQDTGYLEIDSLDIGFHQGKVVGQPKISGVRLYAERWLMLAVYSLNIATVSVVVSLLPSSQLPAQKLFGVQAYPIVTVMSVLVFLTLPATAVSSYLFQTMGIKKTCSIGLVAALVGVWGMVAAANYKWWTLQVVATLTCGFGGAIVGNACTGLSASWFGSDERNMATAVGSTIPQAVAGAAFNYVATSKEGMLELEFFYVALMVTVSVGMYLMLYVESPPTPPSAEERASNATMSETLSSMFQNPNFLILLFAFTLDGYGWGIILITNILHKIGYGQHEADIIMAIARWGSLSPLLISPLTDYLRKQDERWPVWIMRASQGASFFATLGLTLVLKPGMFDYIAFFFFLVGFTTTSAAPLLLELVAEVTYPQPETVSTGICLAVFGVSTFGFVQLSQVMATKGIDGYLHFFWLQNILFAMSVFLMVYVFEAKMKRTQRAKERLSGEASGMGADDFTND